MLLVRTQANRQTIVRSCRASAEAGVLPGMTLAHARALLPRSGGEPCVMEHDPQRDRQALSRLARWATRFAPKVQVDGEDGLLMDVTGCDRLYQGEGNLLAQLLAALGRLGFSTAAVIAPTFGAAWALARHGGEALTTDEMNGEPSGEAVGHASGETSERQSGIVQRLDELPGVLSPLPVEALRLDAETVDALHEVGVRHIGELLNIPRRQLPCRFSDDLMLRMDQALGAAMETIDPVRVPQVVRVEREFDGPVKSAEAVQLAARQLLDDFARELLAQEAGALSLRLVLYRYEAERVAVALSVSRATRDAKHLWQLLLPQLEKANLGHGVEAVELRALETARIAHRQRHQPGWGGDAAREVESEERGRLIDVLSHRLGPDRVMRAARVESHLPERAVRLAPVDRAADEKVVSLFSRSRPTQLFEKPEPVEVHALTPDGPVSRVMWRGSALRVEACAGPERITSEWWRQRTGSRDYFAVRVETGIDLWLFRDGRTGGWFVHGWWA